MRYLALLRGINVGGKSIVRMTDLRACFERLGLSNVSTYIQSGNVLFDSPSRSSSKLAAAIETAVETKFGCAAAAVVLREQDIERVVDESPPEFGEYPEQYRYDVAFLKPPVRPADLLPTIKLKDGVDQAWSGHGVLYLRRLTEKASQSYLSKLTAHPAYKSMTVRNWNTTTALRRLISDAKP